MCNALREAEGLGFDTVQVFTKNQQQWKAPALAESAVSEWRSELARLGWLDRTVSHASYLINLASPNDELWEKSIGLMREEIERCERLSIPYLVHHPGSFVGWTLEEGLVRIGAAYRRLFAETRGYRTVTCLEATAGAGSTIGGKFEELARLRERLLADGAPEERVGICLDTCHVHAAGYDISTREKGDAVLAEFNRVCGLSSLRVVHVNDSKGAAGSRLDRHAHIGEGTIGGPRYSAARLRDSGFASFVCHPRLAELPMILETPKENRKDARQTPWDIVNARRLRALTSATRKAEGGAGRATPASPNEPARRGTKEAGRR